MMDFDSSQQQTLTSQQLIQQEHALYKNLMFLKKLENDYLLKQELEKSANAENEIQ